MSPPYADAFRTTLVAVAFNTMIFSDSMEGRAFDRLEKLGAGRAPDAQ